MADKIKCGHGGARKGAGRKPWLKPEEKRQFVGIRLAPETHAWVETQAKAARKTITAVIEDLIREEMERIIY